MWKLFTTVKPKKPSADTRRCKQCGSSGLKRKVATYPVPLTGKLAGRRLDIYRVELDECRHCGFLMPTRAGQAKIKRCTKVGIQLFLKSLNSP